MGDEFGDFQTPAALVRRVLDCLGPVGRRWARALEPTCGSGSFIRGLLDSPSPPEDILGIEVQDSHLASARRLAGESKSARVRIKRADLFDIDLSRDLGWRSRGPLLVIGNPPWVTNSQLGASGSRNLPAKTNLKGLSGIDALTGSSNFDLAEFIFLKLIRELLDERPAIALLCKTQVARNVLQFVHDRSIAVISAWVRRIDARSYFNASVDACLFYIEIGEGGLRYEAPVFGDLESSRPENVLGFSEGRMIFDLGRYRNTASIEGVCTLVWRQGIKHDAARVMELRTEGVMLVNGLGEAVDVESQYIYPLVKSSDLCREPRIQPRHHVLVPQRRIGEDTTVLRSRAPKLWEYFSLHSDHFDRRKSSIYRGRPPFSIFGVGDYSFSEHKVAVSGFDKTPRFKLISPAGGRPVMLDDTCYFVACDSARQAALLTALLNHRKTADFLRSTMFIDSKRPVTKKLLQRIDLIKLFNCIATGEIIHEAEKVLGQSFDPEYETKDCWPDDLRSLLSSSASLE